MVRIPMTGGFTPMDEGVQVLRIYGVEYKETFGNLTVYMINAKGQTMREVFRFKGKDGSLNEGAMNAFSYFAKTAMDDFNMEDVDPMELVDHYIKVEVVHNESGGKIYANLGREKNVAYEFDESPVPEALTKKLEPLTKPKSQAKPQQTAEPAPQKPVEVPKTSGNVDLDSLLG